MSQLNNVIQLFIISVLILCNYDSIFVQGLHHISEILNYTAKITSPFDDATYKQLAILDEKLASCGNIKDIRDISILTLQDMLSSGEITSAILTSCYVNRINQMNHYLNCVIEVNPDAVRIALKSDYERMLGLRLEYDGDLRGIPVLIKDNIATNDAMQTCSGALALVGHKPLQDSSVVKSLRANGAVILGKANLSEMSYFRGTNIPEGWSGRGNQTYNCYERTSTTYGSSSGCAVATAANLCPVCIGTETDGSIVTPSEASGLVGLKPTLGCVPMDGIIPISMSQDVAGPMGRTVDDVTIVMKAITSCPKLLNSKYRKMKSNQFRIGVLTNPFWISNPADLEETERLQILIEAISKCNDPLLNFLHIDAPPGAFETDTWSPELITLLHEFKVGIEKYLQNTHFVSATDPGHKKYLRTSKKYSHRQNQIKTLADIIRFNEENPSPEGYNQQILEWAEATDGLGNYTYLYARDSNIWDRRILINYLLDAHSLDAIVAPGAMPSSGNSLPLYSSFAIAGYPYITVPAAFSNNAPLGVIFHSHMYSDRILLKIAKIFESCTTARRPPSFK